MCLLALINLCTLQQGDPLPLPAETLLEVSSLFDSYAFRLSVASLLCGYTFLFLCLQYVVNLLLLLGAQRHHCNSADEEAEISLICTP